MYDWRKTLLKAAIHGGIAIASILGAGIVAWLSDPATLIYIKAHLAFGVYLIPPTIVALGAALNNLRKNYEP